MNYAVLTPIRKITRALGINQVLGKLISNKGDKALIEEYNKNKPTEVTFPLFGRSITMNVDNVSEYIRVQSYQNDTHLLKFLFDTLQDGDTFWDVGTNIGLYSLIMASKSPKINVVCFEPEPRCLERLQKNIASNNRDNMKTYELALSSSNGQAAFSTAAEYGDGTHSLLNKEITAGSFTVQTIRGDDFVEQYKVNIPSLLKIDVEGAEIEVLKGLEKVLSNPQCKNLLCEVHFTILDNSGYSNGAKTVIGILKSYNFTTFNWLDASHLAASK
jgi:FkbM family methyltransferase